MSRRAPTRPEGLPTGPLVASARAALGLSPRELGERLGVSRVTVRELELGRDARASTLGRLLDVLDEIAPADLLGGAGRAPADRRGAWAFDRRLHGLHAARVTRELRLSAGGMLAASTHVAGVRAAVTDAAGLTDALRLVIPLGLDVRARLPALASELISGSGRVEATDPRGVHELRLRRGATQEIEHVLNETPRRLAIDRDLASARDCMDAGCALLVSLPIQRLVLRLHVPASLRSARPVVFTWMEPLVPGDDESLDPGARAALREKDGAWTVAIERPPLGLHVAIGWRHDDAKPPRTPRLPRGTTLPQVLRAARESAGLSVRALAEAMNVGAMTVSDAEGGADPRGSTLRAWLAALEGLSPWDLLAPTTLSPAQAWAFRRDLAGCEIETETKEVDISPEGDARMRIETRGLRLLAPRTGALRVHVGLSAPTIMPTRASLRAVATSRDEAGALRISATTGPAGELAHQLAIPETLARAGVSFTRQLHHPGVFSLTPAAAAIRTGRPGPFHEGASFAAVLPVRRLRLIVRFPRSAWPADVTAHAWPMGKTPDPSDPGPREWLHPRGLDLVVAPRARKITLTVDRPLIGAKYGLAWRLPDPS